MTPAECSIIIPVHNKAALTHQCLDSVFEHRPEAPFEVIVVDDASTDVTQEMLASYGEGVRSVRLERNAGFATACNTGAKAAKGDRLLFLNNDTIAIDGWLDALIHYSDEHPEASVVGSKLLFPDGTIQHAGVAFTFSGDPLHIYARCSADHPAVNKSRRFQAVTAACLLIGRDTFLEVDGFDTAFHNDLEDVDLCLRLGALGHEIHYCHESVLYHLESASRGAEYKPGPSTKLYRSRWAARVRHDELIYYLEDGLLDLLRFSPDMVSLDGGRRRREAEILQVRSRQFLDLLRETLRVVSYGEAKGNGRRPAMSGMLGRARRGAATGARLHGPLALRGRHRLESQLSGLRAELASAVGAEFAPALDTDGTRRSNGPPTPRLASLDPTTLTGYAKVQADVPRVVAECVPVGSTVLVVSKGDEALLAIEGRAGWHFPRAEDGRYRGYYPANDENAIAHLEELHERGAEFLALPTTYLWWLEHYPGFARHLDSRYRVAAREESCLVYDMRGDRAEPAAPSAAESVERDYPADEYHALVARVVELVEESLVPGSTVLVATRGDDDLLAFAGHSGWHFPRDEDGRYRGWYPEDDQAAIDDLESLRRAGAEYLVLPAPAMWWLDSYPGFGAHLRGCYSILVEQPEVAVVFELVEQHVHDFLVSLLPSDARIAVAGRHARDLLGLDAGRASWIFPEPDEQAAIARVEQLATGGTRFLVIPQRAFGWLDDNPGLHEHLRARHRFVTRQEQLCEVFELEPPGGQEEVEPAPASSEAPAAAEPAAGAAAQSAAPASERPGGLARSLLERVRARLGGGRR